MNRFVVSRNLHKDPMTNLKNFIQFIDEDYTELFGEQGIVCIFDLVGIREINDDEGREVGDVMIRTAANIVCQYFEASRVFRTEGDAFTVVLKDAELDIENLITQVSHHYNEVMAEKGHPEFYLHPVVYCYDEPIESIEDYYMFLMEQDDEFETTRKFEGDSLVRHILSGVVNRLRLSLEYYEDVYNFAMIDEVSGLPNTKAANEYLGKLTTNVGRRTDKYTVLFIDGDDLRYYNDISYNAGNKMIRRLGEIIKDTIRSEDKIFRWLSGDEFVVMLEGTDGLTGEALAERIRQQVEEHQDEFALKTTISIGVANYPSDGRDADTVIYYAEKANKLAKNQGKNQVVNWREVDVTSI